MEYLAIGPASMGLFTFLGRLKRFETELKNIKEISGASAGALLGTFLALEIPLDDAFDKLMMIDIEGLSKYKLRSFLKNFGFIDCENVRDALIDMYDCNPTFSELKKKLYIAAYNLNRGKTEYFSVDTHPHMHVVDAICMSISIPFVASTKPYNGMIYIDGGTKEITPLEPFIGKPAHRVVSFTLRNEEKYIEKINSLFEYVSTFLNRILNFRRDPSAHMKIKHIPVTTGNFNSFKFKISHDY